MKKIISLLLCAVLSATGSLVFASNQPMNINKIIVFGDSLSDVGNDYRKTEPLHELLKLIPSFAKYFPTGAIPSTTHDPYDNGRFTNGKVWAEDLANYFGMPETDVKQVFHNGAFEDFAYGGAVAYPVIKAQSKFPAPLPKQIDEYIKLHKFRVLTLREPVVQAHTLAIVFIGSNDYLYTPDTVSTNGIAKRVVQTEHDQIVRLYQNGLRNFLVLSIPTLSETPLAQHNSITRPAYAKRMYIMSTEHNLLMPAMLNKLSANKNHPGINIIYYPNVASLLNNIVSNPEYYGFNYSINEPCHALYPNTEKVSAILANTSLLNKYKAKLKNVVNSKSPVFPGYNACDDGISTPNQHVFFDQIHPTRIVHCILATEVCGYLLKKGVHTASGSLKCQQVGLHGADQICQKKDAAGLLLPQL